MNQKSTSDKLLWGIVGGIALIIIASLVVLLRQPEAIAYQEGNEPAVVAHNYLTAIHLNELDRAYGYVSPEVENYPADATAFWTELRSSWYCPMAEEGAYMYGVTEVTRGENTAVVNATTTIYQNRDTLFWGNNSYQNVNNITLQQINGRWYIAHADQCWNPCWNDSNNDWNCGK
jgi:hypothetical protein